jgi:hypothetical protein
LDSIVRARDGQEVVALLNDITAISTAPVGWSAIPLRFDSAHQMQSGEPLPGHLADAAWGTPAPNGLRAAWLDVPSDPSLDKHSIGSHLVESALKEPRQSFAARFEIEKAPAGAWTGKLLTADATAAIAAGEPQPKDEEAQALYEIWQNYARTNGHFPGGLIARLSVKVREFIRNNASDRSGSSANRMEAIVPRLDASHDWAPSEVIRLFDDIAAITKIPLETMLEDIHQHSFQTGSPLPPALAKAPWGDAQIS